MTIKFLSAHHFGKLYQAGEPVKVEDAIGKAFIEGGYAEQISETILEKEQTDASSDVTRS
jgi:hypothetical protein